MLIRRKLAFFLGCFCAFTAYAAESAVPRHSAGVVSYVDVFQWIFGLIIVLAMFGLLVWVLRKTGNFSFDSKSQLSVIAGLSLGMREKLVLVKVGDKQLLLGVTPGRVDKLLELAGDERLFQGQMAKVDSGLFAKKLQQVLQGKTDA